ncbi:S41 family peptidase [Lysobacter sp. Root983]|uniref:S41 family peptidase n=1 Tax=Lysobacter sp. Root983 TaxID=1736613 RepID=UPI00070BEA2B|nr:S41 family peptidase [Lysobacter sp. Root983]KRD74539.1 hypothetical protein ASE43_14975 [Lysobacter sp. Root983]
MAKRSAVAWAIVAGLLCGAAKPEPATDYAALFERVWTRVDQNYYDPGFHGVDWQEAGRRYRAQLRQVRDDAAFKALVARMLGELKSSHTSLSAPSKSGDQRRGIGARFELVDGVQTAVDVSSLSPAWRHGLRPGDQLLGSPDDLPGPLGSRAEVAIRDCAGGERRLNVERVAMGWPPEHPGWRWTRYTPRSGLAVGYLRVDRFDDGAATLADQAMSELADTQALIVDLRRNSGGNTSALRLASYFMPAGETPVLGLFARPYLQKLGHAPSADEVRAGPKVVGAYTDEAVFKAVSEHGGAAVFHSDALDGRRYAGLVLVLIDHETASSGEGFAWVLRLHTPARFIGRASAGELLSGERFALGQGWNLTVPVHGLWGADGRDFADRPVQPDQAVAWTREDYCSGRDPDLEAAMRAASAVPEAAK